MVDKQDYLQNELFSTTGNGGQYKPQRSRWTLFMRIRGYEKVMLLIMGLVLLSVVSFSLGVERGKRVAGIENNNIDQAGYTIQVATFRNRQLALQEARLLLNEGLTPMVFAKGNNIILCVGKFSNQDSAQPLLMQMQRTYAGCRIRRL